MKRRIVKFICLLMCVLLLCSCSPAESGAPAADWSHMIPGDTIPEDIPANWELYRGDIYERTKAGFELYKLIWPNAYVAWSGMGMGRDGFSVDCAGADMDRLAASGILPEDAILEYAAPENMVDPRLPHKIPRKPESQRRYADGVKLTMEHREYPPYPEYIRFDIESDNYRNLDFNENLYKYVDGEWKWCARTYYARLAFSYDNGFEPGVPKTVDLSMFSGKLGVGLYKITLSGYDVKPGEEYSVEFIVTEDAEPLEPLPKKEKPVSDGIALNFFWQCELPENCTALEMAKRVEWPAEACSYSVVQGWAGSREDIAEKLLGEGYEYDAPSDTYTAGTKTLSFAEYGVSLKNSDPEVRAIKLAQPYMHINGNESNGFTLADWAVEQLTDPIEFTGENVRPSNGVLNFALQDALDVKRAELSEAEFAAEYAELEAVHYDFGRSFALYSRRPLVPDAAETACTDVNGGGISGPEISCMVIDDEVVELTVERMGRSFEANDDAVPTVSPYDAAAAVLPKLREIEQEFAVTDAEFCYAYYGGDCTTLHPAWLFTVECGETEQYFAVDARTGDLVSG